VCGGGGVVCKKVAVAVTRLVPGLTKQKDSNPHESQSLVRGSNPQQKFCHSTATFGDPKPGSPAFLRMLKNVTFVNVEHIPVFWSVRCVSG
jgi:hypothetical protein